MINADEVRVEVIEEPTNGESSSPTTTGGGGVAWDATQVRLNAVRIAQQEARARTLQRFVIFGNDLPVTLVALVMVSVFHEEISGCKNSPVLIWLCGVIVLGAGKLFDDVYLPRETSNTCTLRFQSVLSSLVRIWFILGNIWLFTLDKECIENAPHLAYTAFTILGFAYFFLLAPLLILILACLCLPCIIRLVSRGGVRGATKSEIAKLGKKKYEKGQFQGDNGTCAICLSEFEKGQNVRELNCPGKHLFHKDCVDPWFLLNGSCPNCRFIVVGPDKGRPSTVTRQSSLMSSVPSPVSTSPSFANTPASLSLNDEENYEAPTQESI